MYVCMYVLKHEKIYFLISSFYQRRKHQLPKSEKAALMYAGHRDPILHDP